MRVHRFGLVSELRFNAFQGDGTQVQVLSELFHLICGDVHLVVADEFVDAADVACDGAGFGCAGFPFCFTEDGVGLVADRPVPDDGVACHFVEACRVDGDAEAGCFGFDSLAGVSELRCGLSRFALFQQLEFHVGVFVVPPPVGRLDCG